MLGLLIEHRANEDRATVFSDVAVFSDVREETDQDQVYNPL